MTRRGLLRALLGGVAAGFGVGRIAAANAATGTLVSRGLEMHTGRVCLVADDPDLIFEIQGPLYVVSGPHLYSVRGMPFGLRSV